jgi:hypothetical protein
VCFLVDLTALALSSLREQVIQFILPPSVGIRDKLWPHGIET